MPLFDIPVVIPYRLEGDEGGTLHPVQVRTVASGGPAALAAAEVLAMAMGQLRFPDRTIQVLRDRAKMGPIGRQINGPYAYIFTRGSLIHHIAFPARIDSQAGEFLDKTLASIGDDSAFGLVMDCAPLTFINSIGLTALSNHARNIHLFRVPASVAKVFEIVGLDRILRIHSGLQTALDALVHDRPASDTVVN
jgi:anti-anti-sigma regulatory factor